MMTRSRSRGLGGATPGDGGSDRFPGFEGMMTRARHRRRGLADLPLRPRSEPVRSRKRPPTPRVKERRNWANLTADLVRDVAGRLLVPGSPWPASEYNRFRAVCKTWRESTDDPRSCSMDIRFRPRGWKPLRDLPPTSGFRLRHVSGARTNVELEALSTSYVVFAVADGLLLVRDKQRAYVVRLLNPLTGGLTKFPPITEVRAYDGSEPNSGLIDTLKLYISDSTMFRRNFVGIDDSTSPPALVFCVSNNVQYDVVYAKPGDHHWVSVHSLTSITLCSDVGRIVLFLRPPPGAGIPKVIYLYGL